MPFPIVAAALGLAEFAPVIARWLGGNQAESVAAQVVDMAKRITGTEDSSDAVKSLRENSFR